MHPIDWLIVIFPLFLVAYIGFKTRRYLRGVSDFLVAGRVAGRYVVCVADGMAAMGLISAIAMFEFYYKSGFAINFWWGISTPLTIVFLLNGFAIYRYRETRVLTMSQFFEVRYSKSFRIFTGALQAMSGIFNYALFPAVGARFLMYFCDLPVNIHFLSMNWPTYGVLMALFLGIAVLMVTLGGQITVMTIDCVQGILCYPMYLVIVVAILVKFSWWGEMAPTILSRPPGESMLNPYDTYNLSDFNLFFIAVGIFSSIYNIISWSGNQGYNAAAKTPHEQKMGKVLGTWRTGFSGMMFILLAVAAYTYMHNANFANSAAKTERKLDWKVLSEIAPDKGFENQPASDELMKARVESLNPKSKQVYKTISEQMLVPVVIRDILPIGVTGLFCAVMIFMMIGTDTMYLHSWGSIVVQDVILPCRQKAFTPKQQLLALRIVISLVAVFAFFFSLYFGQVTYILMFFALTGSVWLGGAGAVILGGLYWKRGTTQGAWSGLLTGAILAILGFILTESWVGGIYPFLADHPVLLSWVTTVIEGVSNPLRPIINWRVTPGKFPINGQEIYFLTMLFSVLSYVLVSLFTCREPFNMDRMLHRGKYRRESDLAAIEAARPPRSFNGLLKSLVGIDAQFTRGDKVLSWSVFIYSMVWGFGSWLTVFLWSVLKAGGWPKQWWCTWFFIQQIVVAFAIGVVSTVWFTIGGTIGLRRMYRDLANHKSDVLDDGRVVGAVSAVDIAAVAKVEHTTIEERQEAKDILK
jgi:solute:Na+ symporter, SSS family